MEKILEIYKKFTETVIYKIALGTFNTIIFIFAFYNMQTLILLSAFDIKSYYFSIYDYFRISGLKINCMLFYILMIILTLTWLSLNGLLTQKIKNSNKTAIVLKISLLLVLLGGYIFEYCYNFLGTYNSNWLIFLPFYSDTSMYFSSDITDFATKKAIMDFIILFLMIGTIFITKILLIKKCSNCGAKVSLKQKFCKKCGNKL